MDYHAILMTIIAFSAVISVLSVIFHWLLTPVRENQARMEKGQGKLEQGQKQLERGQVQLEKGQVQLEKEISEIKHLILKAYKS